MPSNARKRPTTSSSNGLINRFRQGSEVDFELLKPNPSQILEPKATSVATLKNVNGDPSKMPLPERVWSHWLQNATWRDKLHKRAAHKALDIDEEPMISADRQTINYGGLGWKEMAVLGALGLGGLAMFRGREPAPAATPPAAVQPAEPTHTAPPFNDTDTVTDVKFPE